MKRPSGLTVIIIGLGLLMAGVFAYVVLTSAQPSQPFSSGQSQPDPEPTPPKQPSVEQTPGAYLDYSDVAFANTTATHRLLFFYAAWCPQCRALEKSIEQTGVPAGVAIFKINFDSATELRSKYGITIQTTIVQVDAQGALVKKHVAYDNPTLKAVLDSLGL
ncbi:MAG TPA: thioredoxin family protein [Candidatus Saccharimonadales bacterium]|nr:thioredoxin family protein [Candidatus Saccharimonadales bacterium]